MPPVASRRLLELFLSLIVVLALGVLPAVCNESYQVAGTVVLVRKDHSRFCVDKAEGHYLCLYIFEGCNHSTGKSSFMDHATATHCLFADAVKRNGPIQGYTIFSDQGRSALFQWIGQWTTTQSADGSSLSVFEGSFRIVKGTGQFSNIEGTGTFKGRMTTPIVQVVEWEGEYSIRK